MKSLENIAAFTIAVQGVVQGVGFRPFIYQLSAKHHLNGWVYNTSNDVTILIEGKTESINHFISDLHKKLPPRAFIEHYTIKKTKPAGHKEFVIRNSVVKKGKYQLISPDIATCRDCRNEILDPHNRRYRYPFTNCTNCGPRFTIIKDIPYDRSRTTMECFDLCPECTHEYNNPLDRRFHAQPNACPVCGPQLELLDFNGKKLSVKDVNSETAKLLKMGYIVAIKGLGGFLLACDATNDNTVDQLRIRKKRPGKPFAVMVDSVQTARRYCYVNSTEEKILQSPQSPIVLLKAKSHIDISPSVAPGLRYLGIMLPYTPLQHLLLEETRLPLIMTSGNLSEEPIARENEEAIQRLYGIPDYFLVHNRQIYSTYDDSVVVVDNRLSQIVRRARGYAPFPIKLKTSFPQGLACGAQEKNTFCLTRDDHAFVSQHIGDLDNQEGFDHYTETIELYKKIFRIRPKIITADMHPDYASTRYAKATAEQSGLQFIPVQHHHAHVVSTMVDAGINSPVIGVAFDGTGYGTDGLVWGGEFLFTEFTKFERKAHIQYLPIAGGDTAIMKPYRIALSYLISLFGENSLNYDLPFLKLIKHEEIDIISRQIERSLNAPLTSSCGRLFDAVSALLNIRGEIQYDAQAAIELEVMAWKCNNDSNIYPITWKENDGIRVIDVEGLFRAIIDDILCRVPTPVISARFHNTIAKMTYIMCQSIYAETGIKQVVLTGGVFQNRYLLKIVTRLFKSGGFSVSTNRQVPCNDGGISLGQAVIGGCMLTM